MITQRQYVEMSVKSLLAQLERAPREWLGHMIDQVVLAEWVVAVLVAVGVAMIALPLIDLLCWVWADCRSERRRRKTPAGRYSPVRWWHVVQVILPEAGLNLAVMAVGMLLVLTGWYGAEVW